MPEASFTEIISDECAFGMIQVEGGTFMMGSEDKEAFEIEKPIHEVSLDSFWMGQYPVTQKLWEAVMSTNPSFFKGPNRPVEQVSWEECQAFLKKLNAQTGKVYRLPTEAEWEYAARGGLKSEGFRFAGSNKLKEVAWYDINSHGETKIVGQKLPNELEIYDMSGNIWEWCHDYHSDTYYQECIMGKLKMNLQGPKSGTSRITRGGAWFSSSQFCQIWFRDRWRPGNLDNGIGLRLAFSEV